MTDLRIFNMEITIRCSRCKTECALDDIFENPATMNDPGKMLLNAIHKTRVKHMERGECRVAVEKT